MKESNFKYKNFFDNIKSRYIVQQIFNNLLKIKSLRIIKNNKEIQNKLDITINDYKQLSQIEIEIIPLKYKYGKFIYILNENDESYYHIYFNDSDKETKNHYISEKDQVKKIKIIIENKVKSLYKLFYSCNCIETITFQNYDRNNIEDMSCMFMCCSAKEVNFSVFNTENVKNMS